jgi:hypothetical protein
MSQVFLSYHRADRKRARQIAHRLAYEGYGVWWDRADRPGDRWSAAVTAALSRSRCVIVIWSKSSQRAAPILAEATVGYARGALVSLTVGRATPPSPFDEGPAIDVTDWDGDSDDLAWMRLQPTLMALLGDGGRIASAPAPMQPNRDLPPLYPIQESRRVADLGRPMTAMMMFALVGAGVAGWTFRERLPTPGEAVESAKEALAKLDAATEARRDWLSHLD